MSVPQLVENQVKNVLNYNLGECHQIKLKMTSLLYNMACVIFIGVVVGSILYYKYKGHQNIDERNQRENQKRDYILYNLRKFQNIKNKYMTNISFE